MSILTPNRTHASSMDAQAANTYPGMAHFAGTGPEGATCRTCIHWATRFWDKLVDGSGQVATDALTRSFRRDPDTGDLRPRRCKKHYRMMQHVLGEAVPHTAQACMFHVANEAAPPIERPPRKKPARRANDDADEK